MQFLNKKLSACKSYFFCSAVFSFICTASYSQQIFEDVLYEPGYLNDIELTIDTKERAARAFFNIKNYHIKTAEEIFDSIVSQNATSVIGKFGQAYCKFADGDYELCIDLLTPIINLKQNDANLFSLRGRCYMQLEKFTEAAEDFIHSTQLPNIENDKLNLSICYFYLSDFNASIAQANEYILQKPKNSNGYFVKGLSLVGLKNYVEAVTNIEKSIDLSPKNSLIPTQYSKVLIEMNEMNKAVKYLNKAIKNDAENSEAIELRADIRYRLNDYSNAIFDCNRLIELDEASAKSFVISGKSNLKLGLKKIACSDFLKAQKLGSQEATELLTKNCN